MPLGQGWLNAWVKVNNKHVVYPRNDREVGEGQSATVAFKHAGKSSGTISSGKTAKTAISEDAESRSIRRVNSRKNKRRLNRTTSASDLIRDQAKRLGEKSESEAALDVSTSSNAIVGQAGGVPSLERLHIHSRERFRGSDEDQLLVESQGSIRFMAGLLDTDVDTLSLEPLRVPGHERWDLDTASLQWVPATHDLDAASIPSRGGYSLPPRTSNTAFHRAESDDSASKGGFRFPIFSNDKGQCRHCSRLENDLVGMKEDLEYLRSVALRNEFVCISCKREPSGTGSAAHHDTRSNERLLEEVTARHKAQLEQLTKDRVSSRLSRCVHCDRLMKSNPVRGTATLATRCSRQAPKVCRALQRLERRSDIAKQRGRLFTQRDGCVAIGTRSTGWGIRRSSCSHS